jgi:hypothetical protein
VRLPIELCPRNNQQQRVGHSAIILPNGMVLIAGGLNSLTDTRLASAELFDPAKKAFVVTSSMSATRSAHQAVMLPTGKVLIEGGFDGTADLASSELYF